VKWPILYASVEHRAWVAEVEEFLQGDRLAAPRMDHHLCRFDALHQKLHAHANGILDLKDRDVGTGEFAGLTELRTLRDGLLEKLQYFVQSV
jgi:hypothetical protein